MHGPFAWISGYRCGNGGAAENSEIFNTGSYSERLLYQKRKTLIIINPIPQITKLIPCILG